MNVYIVFREGPEWSDPIKCFEDKRAAESSAAHHNQTRDVSDVHESLSSYRVVQMGVIAKRGRRSAAKIRAERKVLLEACRTFMAWRKHVDRNAPAGTLVGRWMEDGWRLEEKAHRLARAALKLVDGTET